jgi:membrane associated rhomboid family serine protease
MTEDDPRSGEGESDRIRDRLRRSRFTVPTYLAGALWFVGTGFYTGAWAPALLVSGLCLGLAALAYRLRRRRRRRLRVLELLEGEDDPPLVSDDGAEG